MNNKELVIIKVGTNSLVDHDYDTLHGNVFTQIGDEIHALQDAGYAVILVSSGAISAGVMGDAKKREHINDTVELQRYAARGWDTIVQNWKQHLGSEHVSSTLLTKRELHNDTMRRQICKVIMCCLSHGDTFLVNENDTISNDEITFGDNDQLAVELAIALQKENIFASIQLILLTNTNGLYADIQDESTRIKAIYPGDDVSRHINDSHDTHSRGGMTSKLRAATRAAANNIDVFIADGRASDTIHQALKGTAGTHFIATQ